MNDTKDQLETEAGAATESVATSKEEATGATKADTKASKGEEDKQVSKNSEKEQPAAVAENLAETKQVKPKPTPVAKEVKRTAAADLAPSLSGIEPEKKPIPLKSAPKTSEKEHSFYNEYNGGKKFNRNNLSSLLSTENEVEVPKELVPPTKGQVFYATGRRKTSSARVFMQGGQGTITVNGDPIEEYFPFPRVRHLAIQPLLRLKGEGIFNLNISVKGGGTEGQAGAIKHGLARALLKYDEDLKRFLRKNGYLTRDPRSVERKKVGLHKARKSPQFSKR